MRSTSAGVKASCSSPSAPIYSSPSLSPSPPLPLPLPLPSDSNPAAPCTFKIMPSCNHIHACVFSAFWFSLASRSAWAFRLLLQSVFESVPVRRPHARQPLPQCFVLQVQHVDFLTSTSAPFSLLTLHLQHRRHSQELGLHLGVSFSNLLTISRSRGDATPRCWRPGPPAAGWRKTLSRKKTKEKKTRKKRKTNRSLQCR